MASSPSIMLADERCTRRDERALTAQCKSQHLGGRAGRVETRSAEVDVASQRFGERREMGLHDVPDDIDFDTEVPVDEDVAQAPDAAGDVPMRVSDLCRECFTASPMICRLRSIASSAISTMPTSASREARYRWHRSMASRTSEMRCAGSRLTARPRP